MDGKEIAGLTIASFSSLTAITLWIQNSRNKLGDWNETAPVAIFLLLLFSIITFIIFGVEKNDSSKPDKILHVSLAPYYSSCLFVIIGICIFLSAVLGKGRSHRVQGYFTDQLGQKS